jgi:glycosyltransferase involved in cell wall biosynthesis
MSTITMLPSQDAGNIYTVLLYRALETVGLRYVQFPPSLLWVLRHGPQDHFHYVHFHWPEVFFNLRLRAWRRLWGLKHYLHAHALWVLLKLRGYRLVWTVHEVDVHDIDQLTWMHALSRRFLYRLADMVFTHTPDVRADMERRWGRKRHADTIPIGSYEGAYPMSLSRAAARDRLRIPSDAFVFVFFGNVRPYKGVDLLIDAFEALQADHPEAHLIVAGKPYSQEFAAAMQARCAGLHRLRLQLDYVPDAEIQVYLRAADCFVAPYKYIETCSAIYLALAFELPIIIKSEGNVVEFEPRDIGLFLADATHVGAAMRRMLEMPAADRERMRANTLAASRDYSWDRLRHRYRAAFDRFEAEHGGGAGREGAGGN